MKRIIQTILILGIIAMTTGDASAQQRTNPYDEACRLMFLLIPSEEPMKVSGRTIGEFTTYGCGIVVLPLQGQWSKGLALSLSKFRSDFRDLQITSMLQIQNEGRITIVVDRKYPDNTSK